jgi:hypothetical protein
VYEIILELVKDRDDVGDRENLAFPLVTATVMDEALKRAGFAIIFETNSTRAGTGT